MTTMLEVPWPEGLVPRPARYVAGPTDDVPHPDDLAAVVALTRACDIAVVGEPDSGADDVAGMFTGPITDREATQLVHDAEGRLAAFVWIERDVEARETWVDVYVDPERADPAVLDAGVAHGRRTALQHRADAGGDDDWSLRSGCFAGDAPLVEALERAGFERVRRFYRMSIDLDSPDVPAQAPALPEGAELVVVRSDEERRRVYALRNASFQDHWHDVPREYDEWLAFHDPEIADPDGWWLLTVDGVDAAICLMDESRADLGGGYVRTLGVTREHRGRGLAALLLQRAFVYYRDKGRRTVQLGVDSESPTGADRLYARVGMSPLRVIDAWSLPIG
ncbi:MAG: GNAT family N-acetyltransferase [Candidatus Nanopelagicales bacterium]